MKEIWVDFMSGAYTSTAIVLLEHTALAAVRRADALSGLLGNASETADAEAEDATSEIGGVSPHQHGSQISHLKLSRQYQFNNSKHSKPYSLAEGFMNSEHLA